jgi:predicted transcriptional regulator
MKKKQIKTRQHWTTEELNALDALSAAKLTPADIAKKLNRPYSSVYNLINGQNPRPVAAAKTASKRTVKHWSKAEKNTVRSYLVEGLDAKEIAELTHRPISSVYALISAIKKSSKVIGKPTREVAKQHDAGLAAIDSLIAMRPYLDEYVANGGHISFSGASLSF